MSTVDRSNLVSDSRDGGPFYDEWVDKATGLNCIVLRTASGAWCGYVDMPTNVDDVVGVYVCDGGWLCEWVSHVNGARRLGFVIKTDIPAGCVEGAHQTMGYAKSECEKTASRLHEVSTNKP